MTCQRDLFDQREALANSWLGESLFHELRGDYGLATYCADRANVVDAELRRMAGL